MLWVSQEAKHIIPEISFEHVIVPDGPNETFYIHEAVWKRLTTSLKEKYIDNPHMLKKYEEDFLKAAKKYVNFARDIGNLDFARLSNTRLREKYLSYQRELLAYSVYVSSAFILNNLVADRALEVVNTYLLNETDIDKEVFLRAVMEPKMKTSALKLQQMSSQLSKDITEDHLNELYEKYKWMPCQDLHNEPWTKQQFKDAYFALSSASPQDVESLDTFIGMLNIKQKDQEYLLLAQTFAYIKDVRDEYRRKGVCYSLAFSAAIAKRMKIPAKDMSYLLPSEIVDFLSEGKTPQRNVISERKKGFVMCFDKNKEIMCLHGHAARKILQELKIKTKVHNIPSVKGRVASKGQAKGKVKIVQGLSDLPKVNLGDIMVAVSTHPDYTIAMRKACAIVTDEGGITSHAAIVSREFGIPCIVGTGNATQFFKDGDMVALDTETGTVKKV